MPKVNGVFDFETYQIKIDSGRKTKIGKFCATSLVKKELAKKEKSFFEWVINNAK